MASAVVEIRGVSKAFGPTHALRDVSLEAHAGRVHAVTGENGAGKSTLMKLLAGVHVPDAGELRLDGKALRLRRPADARAAGISTVFQELTVLPNLTVAENMLLGHEPRRGAMLDRAGMHRRAAAVLERVGLALDPGMPCADLSVGEQQMLEIAKGLSLDARVFIFDEPTAPLNRAEVDRLESLLRQLRAMGRIILYISHRLDEIFRFCDDVTVLKDGRRVATQPIGTLDENRLIGLMVGRPLSALFPSRPDPLAGGPVALDVQHLRPRREGPVARLTLRHGEIVGLAGLEGQGQREIVRALAGLAPPAEARIRRTAPDGSRAPYEPKRGVVAAVAQGVALVPEDRKSEGLYLGLSVEENMQLGALRGRGLARSASRDRQRVEALAKRLELRAASLRQPVSALSGGNQQKVMLGRWFAAGVDTLLVEQPTRGVDVGAKAQIYALLREFCDEGGAVLAVSADLPELIGLCDRILVVRGGEVVAEVPAQGSTEEGLLELALDRPARREAA